MLVYEKDQDKSEIWYRLHYLRMVEYFIILKYYYNRLCKLEKDYKLLEYMQKKLQGILKDKYLNILD